MWQTKMPTWTIPEFPNSLTLIPISNQNVMHLKRGLTMDGDGMKRRFASMAEKCNDRCEEYASKRYDGTCLCSVAVIALKSKTNTNPGR
ncbi:uncharacterized protein DS421_17g596960 [Arachis hypogaea]|nr:uncharacterized protein DS421_17g596960 [Arachis hypogaea]